MKKLNKIQNIVFIAGAVLLLIGAATFFTGWLYAFYFYAVGAFAAMQLCAGYEGDNLVIRRLRGQQVIGALLLVCTAFFMAMRIFDFGFARRQEWVVCLAVACVLELYTAFRIPAELEKEEPRNNNNKFKNGKDKLK
mgnify:CR=1 FL=1